MVKEHLWIVVAHGPVALVSGHLGRSRLIRVGPVAWFVRSSDWVGTLIMILVYDVVSGVIVFV
jgi:hypothetical protein